MLLPSSSLKIHTEQQQQRQFRFAHPLHSVEVYDVLYISQHSGDEDENDKAAERTFGVPVSVRSLGIVGFSNSPPMVQAAY